MSLFLQVKCCKYIVDTLVTWTCRTPSTRSLWLKRTLPYFILNFLYLPFSYLFLFLLFTQIQDFYQTICIFPSTRFTKILSSTAHCQFNRLLTNFRTELIWRCHTSMSFLKNFTLTVPKLSKLPC